MAKEFNTIAVDDGIAMGHGGMLYSLPSRELIADAVTASASETFGLCIVPTLGSDISSRENDQSAPDCTFVALITMLRDRGALQRARDYARDFATAHPSDPAALQLLNELGVE